MKKQPAKTEWLDWINIRDKTPNSGDKVLTYFEFSGIEIHTYKDVSEEIEVINGEEHKGIFGNNMFYNKSGYLTDDIEWWMPLPELPNKKGDKWNA